MSGQHSDSWAAKCSRILRGGCYLSFIVLFGCVVGLYRLFNKKGAAELDRDMERAEELDY